MADSAYLVLVLDINGPRPIASSVGVFSMPANCITMDHSRVAALDVWRHDAADYATAHRELLCIVESNPALAWCRSILHVRSRP
jgi:hypothetical protein